MWTPFSDQLFPSSVESNKQCFDCQTGKTAYWGKKKPCGNFDEEKTPKCFTTQGRDCFTINFLAEDDTEVSIHTCDIMYPEECKGSNRNKCSDARSSFKKGTLCCCDEDL